MDKKTIFFIEDEKEILELYTSQLKSHDFIVESFKDGNEVLARINSVAEGKSTPPEVIVLDLLLSDISGLSILGELKSKPVFNKTLVIVFTNYVSEDLQQSVSQMDNVLYLAKIDTAPSALVDIIKSKVH